ncbi:MAG: hypothetical protein HC778_00530 [Chamaesiphon sp. CSU_1_12]|nr:hypothetical protein [Chamaesiphon sp. CSU_1_12]
MTAAPSAKPKVGTRNLLPFYVGITRGRNLKGVAYAHTHYVLIDQKVATQLGIKAKGSSKPGATDTLLRGIVYQNNRKKTKGDKKNVVAKRYITQSKKSITVTCKQLVLNSKQKLVSETYTIGFASSIPLRLILEFFKKNAPNVIKIGTGGKSYQIRGI